MNLNPTMESHTITLEGRAVFYSARGPEDAEYAYVGINGLMGGGDSFWPVIEGVPENWRVFLPDLPGCNESDLMLPPHKHNIDGYVRWLEAFLREVGLSNKKIVLASVATGAPISIRYTFEHPDQVVAQVLHLPFFGKPAVPSRWTRPLVAYGLLTPPVRALLNKLRASNWIMHRIIITDPPDAIPVLAERDIDHKQDGDLEAAGELLHDLMLTDARSQLALIHSPVLILASEHDSFAPLPMLEAFVRNRHNIRTYIYTGGQHSWNEEFIDEMNRELSQFIDNLMKKR
jgi:pimeloyl-ACP methyl ester carboxylesterase